jgi:hypothetical protein
VLVQSAKVKVRTTIYLAWKKRIDEEAKTWKENYLTFHVYQDASHSTLKVEGSSTKDVARARKLLNEISEGVVLTDGGTSVWSSTLDSNGVAYRNLKVVEKELQVVIDRSKSKRQLRFYGPPEKYQQTIHLISAMLEKECRPTYEINPAGGRTTSRDRSNPSSRAIEALQASSPLTLIKRAHKFAIRLTSFKHSLVRYQTSITTPFEQPNTSSTSFFTITTTTHDAQATIQTAPVHVQWSYGRTSSAALGSRRSCYETSRR